MSDTYCESCGARLVGPGDNDAKLPAGHDGFIEEWANSIIRGVGGLHDFEAYEMAIANIERDVAVACWVIKCLGNIHKRDTERVVDAINRRRAKLEALA